MPDPTDQKATTPPDPGLIPADADVRQGNSREEPAPTTRDRELANEVVKGAINGRYLRERIVRSLAQRFQEGREEALTEAATEALDEAAYLRSHLDDPHQADGATRVERRISRLLTQPPRKGQRSKTMPTHALQRTSPMGEPFLGECILCGEEGLTAGDALKSCENVRELTNDAALLELIEGPEETP